MGASTCSCASVMSRQSRLPRTARRRNRASICSPLGSAAQERQPHSARVVLVVRIHEDDPLPRAERHSPAPDREDQRRGHEDGQQVIAAVSDRAVTVRVSVVARQQPLEEPLEVFLRSRSRLHERETRRRVRREHVEQSVATRARRERRDPIGDVHDSTAVRVETELLDVHTVGPGSLAAICIDDGTSSAWTRAVASCTPAPTTAMRPPAITTYRPTPMEIPIWPLSTSTSRSARSSWNDTLVAPAVSSATLSRALSVSVSASNRPKPTPKAPTMPAATASGRCGAVVAAIPTATTTRPATTVTQPSVISTPETTSLCPAPENSAHDRNEPITSSAPPTIVRIAPIGARGGVVASLTRNLRSSGRAILPSPPKRAQRSRPPRSVDVCL